MKSEIAAVLAAASAFCLYATSYTWIGGTEGAWNVAANWAQTDDSSVHAVPSSWQDTATLACEDGDITITCSGWLEPALVFATNVTFHVASGTATVKGAHSGTGNITKTGAGELVFQGSSSRKGSTYINEGRVIFQGEHVLGENGLCVIGDGIHDAILQANRDNGWPARFFGPSDGKGTMVIKNKGVLEFSLSNNNKCDAIVDNLTIEEGGEARMGSHSFRITSNTGYYTIAGDLTFLESPELNNRISLLSGEFHVAGNRQSTLLIPNSLSSQYQYVNGYICAKLSAEGGNGLEVDMHILGPIVDAWDARDGIDIKGTGTVKLSGDNSTYGGNVSTMGNTRVQSGRLLVDNTEGSGTGYSKVVVSAGATLGGVGTIGGLMQAKTYNGRGGNAAITDPCVVVNGAAGNPGVLAPGSYEDTTNARIYGTLTVGGEDSPSSVTMNANTKLAFEAGKGGATGLKVYGPLTLGSNVVLDVNVRDDAKTGDYVLVSATGGITGDYTLTGNAGAAKVVRSENQILLKIRKGLTITFR